MSNPSLPEKPKSLADEVMELAQRLVDKEMLYEWGGREYEPALKAAKEAIRSRLLAIESELNDLRKENQLWVPRPSIGGGSISSPPLTPENQGQSIWYADPAAADKLRLHDADRTSVPPRVESHSTLVNELTAHSQAIGEYGPPLEQPPELPVENDLGISEDDGNRWPLGILDLRVGWTPPLGFDGEDGG